MILPALSRPINGFARSKWGSGRVRLRELAVVAALASVPASVTACAGASAPRVVTADSVGSCTSGSLFVVPASARAGQSIVVAGGSGIHCTPGSYPVRLSVVGQRSDAWNVGTVTAAVDGTIAGTVHIPTSVPPGFARAYVVARFTCAPGKVDCSSGASGTLTVLPAATG